MKLGRLGVWSWVDGLPAEQTLAFARKVEAWGYDTLWIPEAMGREPFALAGWLLAQTTTLNIATLAPMPTPSVSSAASTKPGCRLSDRNAKRTS